MMKKLTAGLLVLVLCFSLTACGGGEEQVSGENVQENGAVLLEETTEEATIEIAEETEEALMTIETGYGAFFYPGEWKDALTTNESIEDNFLTLDCGTVIRDQEYRLFRVMVNSEEGDSVGTITGEDGTTRNVFVEIFELSDLLDLTEEEQNQLYAMQEGLNVLIEHLEH